MKHDRYEITEIGTIEMGIDGSDQYFLVRDLEQEIDQEHVFCTIMPRHYRECDYPGAYFCKNLRVIPDRVLEDRCIVIVEHRYDI